MIKLLLIASAFFSKGDVTDSSSFYDWWQTTAYERSHNVAPKGIRDKQIHFSTIEQLQHWQDSLPQVCVNHIFKRFIIFKYTNYSITLAVPTDSSHTISWLKVLPFDNWISLDVYPFTSDCYRPNEVTFRLFWLPNELYPYIEIVTNGPACVPMDLFRFDSVEMIYKHVRHLCGA